MFSRYAIFHTPPPGPFADFCASWLGWDSARGISLQHPALAGIDVAAITAKPRKYGLHATLKAPFRPLPGLSGAVLCRALDVLAARLAPVTLSGLDLGHNGRFTALRPLGDATDLNALAASTLRHFDPFRATMTPADVARRRQAPLTPRQDAQMLEWGYPYVFDDFQFHVTLSGTLPPEQGDALVTALRPVLMPLVPQPYRIDALTLMGEAADGMFHQIHRADLTGPA